MAIAETDQSKLGYIAESTWGTTPSASRVLVRFTGETLTNNIQYAESDELTADRQIEDAIQVGQSVEGGFSHELSYGNTDNFLDAMLCDDWTADYTITATTIALDHSAKTLTDSGAGFTVASLPAGKWVKVSGYSTNGTFYVRVSATVAATTSVITYDYMSKTLSTESAGDSVTIKSDGMARNSTDKVSFTLEKEMSDVTQFISYTGCRVSTASLTFPANEKVTGEFTFLGKAGARAGATVGTGADTAAPTNQIMNAASDISTILEDGSATSEKIISLTVNHDNGLRSQPEVASLPTGGIGLGKSRTTIDIELYFQDGTAYDRYVNQTTYALSWTATDSAGNVFIFSGLKVKPISSPVQITGPNGDVTMTQTLLCIRDTNIDGQFQIDRFDA